MPFYALASAPLKGNTDAHSAAALVAARRKNELGVSGPATLSAWARALESARAGRHGPLPSVPEGFLRIERVQTPADECVELVMQRHGQEWSLNGSALVLAGSRAVGLDVVIHQPSDCAELSLVRSTLLRWVAAVRDSNR